MTSPCKRVALIPRTTAAALLTLISGIAFAELPSRAGEPAWLAFGDLRGHLEPCGCDPATDLGGILRLAIQLQRERSAHPELRLFALGNDVPPPNEPALKTPFLVEADARLKSTAALLNVLELQRLSALGGTKTSLPPYVLSNAKPETAAAKLASPMIADAQLVVFGYTYAAAVESMVVRASPSLVAAWKKRLDAAPGGYRVLLFSGPDADLALLAPLFDRVISSNTSPMDTLPGVAEKADQSKLKRQTDVMMVPLGGQGLVRGGALRFDLAKPVAELLKQAPPPPPGSDPVGSLFHASATLVSWLDPEMATGTSPLQDLYDRYQGAARQAFATAGAARLKDLQASPYAGAAKCTSCHAAQAQVYQGTAHAHAMATLASKGKDKDAECVACHAVGATAKGGFVAMEASPWLANVQCENCHGPRAAHALDPANAKKSAPPASPASAACVGCHNAQHSPKFDFSVYWPRIQH